ncbi:uncharacterized protein L201_007151 [Kwoniella dendrophila CBS 6074]|uniref:Uncharacterized protein n=1 Tax=Kwoniella dendrophila CBS 6074 TaxID=1295534 RepID=A0AAX4K3R1_9TREE
MARNTDADGDKVTSLCQNCKRLSKNSCNWKGHKLDVLDRLQTIGIGTEQGDTRAEAGPSSATFTQGGTSIPDVDTLQGGSRAKRGRSSEEHESKKRTRPTIEDILWSLGENKDNTPSPELSEADLQSLAKHVAERIESNEPIDLTQDDDHHTIDLTQDHHRSKPVWVELVPLLWSLKDNELQKVV